MIFIRSTGLQCLRGFLLSSVGKALPGRLHKAGSRNIQTKGFKLLMVALSAFLSYLRNRLHCTSITRIWSGTWIKCWNQEDILNRECSLKTKNKA